MKEVGSPIVWCECRVHDSLPAFTSNHEMQFFLMFISIFTKQPKNNEDWMGYHLMK